MSIEDRITGLSNLDALSQEQKRVVQSVVETLKQYYAHNVEPFLEEGGGRVLLAGYEQGTGRIAVLSANAVDEARKILEEHRLEFPLVFYRVLVKCGAFTYDDGVGTIIVGQEQVPRVEKPRKRKVALDKDSAKTTLRLEPYRQN